MYSFNEYANHVYVPGILGTEDIAVNQTDTEHILSVNLTIVEKYLT